jgi:hypothetical protein
VHTGYGPDVFGTISVLPTFAPTGSAPLTGTYHASVYYKGRAVPGDPVTFWTHAVGATTFVKGVTTKANSSGTWAINALLRGDTVWKVTTPTGATAPATVRVAPTLTAPASVPVSTLVTFAGVGLPGQKLYLYQRPKATGTYFLAGTVTIGSTGSWSYARHVTSTSDFWAISHSQRSVTRTVTTS